MKYLFFDIECADGGKATICSFGYVIADMKFNIIEQRDILINPEAEFNLESRKGRKDVKLAYEREAFLAAPTFDKVYDEIKALLEDKDFYIVGHAVDNDVKYINVACKRYGLPCIEFEYFDIQRTYMDIKRSVKKISLENEILGLGLESEVVYHRSDEDARATMLVLQKLFCEAGRSFEDYALSSYACTGRTYDFYWGWNDQPSGKYNDVYELKHSYTKEFIKEQRPGEENRILRSTENYYNFLRYAERGAPFGEAGELFSGKKVCISLNYEAEHFKEMLYIVGRIKANGGEYTGKPAEADVFVTYFFNKRGEPTEGCSRLKEFRDSLADGREATVIDLDELFALIDLTADKLAALPEIREDYFLEVREY